MKTPFHILIIEDNPDDCADIRQMLLRGSDVHYRFTEASTGAAGLRACREAGEAAPDLVLLDFLLPDLDAAEMLLELRNGKDLLPFPVIVLTGTDRRIGPQMLHAGAQDFLGKSWATPESLTRAVENATERWAMTRELQARSTALQLSQQQLQLAAEVAGLAVSRIDYATDTIVLDTLAAAMFGLKAGVPLPRQALHATFHPEDKDEIFQHINRSLDPNGKGWFVLEHRVVRPDGSVRWLSVKKHIEFGQVNGILAPVTGLLAAMDITVRKQAEDVLRESQQFMGRVLDGNLAAFVGVTTTDGTVTYANRFPLEAAGIQASEVFGKKFWDCYWWSHSSETQAQLREACERAANGEIVRYDVPVRMAGDTRMWVDFQVAPLRDAGGRITHLIPSAMDISGRRATEAALRSSEIRYRRLFEAAKDGVLILDGQTGRITDANPYILEALGSTHAEVIGQDLWEIGVFADANASRAEMAKLQDRGYIRYDDLPLESKTGQRREVEVVANAYQEDGNRVIQCNIRDISERKRVEEKLREGEREIKAARDYAEATLRTAPIPLVVLRADLRVNTANDAFYKIFQVAPAETEGALFYDLGNRQWNIPKLRHLLEEILPINNFFKDFEITHEFETIGRRTMLLSARRTENEAGQPLQTVLAIEDITDRKQASQYARSLIEASLDPLVTISAEGKITDVNEGSIMATGVTREKLIGTDFSDYFTEPEKAREGYQQVFAKGFVTDYPLTIRHKDGRLTDVLYNASVYKDLSDNVLGVFAAARDITDRKQAEEALIGAKEHAEAASKAKDNFLAALSHELRTPLTPVLMTASSLATDPTLPIEAREQLDMMRRNIELEARLIDDLLDLTTISSGKLTLAPVTSDVHELLLYTDEIIRSDGLGKRLHITLKFDAAQHHALADPVRLQQVFWNLLRNAVKFTPNGGTIAVSTRNDAEGRIIISVADDGIGIRAEALAQIFDAFDQADTAGEHRYGGLGLGLAISSAIVNAHGGQIKAESQGLGEGADFTITLSSVPAPAEASQQVIPSTQPTRAMTLLIVEDHEATRTVLERLLTRSGHLVITAGNVHDALAAYKAGRFDAVISDLGLPDGSGIDLMAQIQSIRPVPAIALSGYGMEDDLRRSTAAGFFAHLVKPVKMDRLKQLLLQIPAP